MSSSGFPSNTETSEIAGRSQPEHGQSEAGPTPLSKLAERVIASCPDGIFTHDLEFRLTLWNPTMERLSGIRKEEALGKVAFDLFPFLKGDGADKTVGGKLSGATVVYDEVPCVVPQTGQRSVYQCEHSPLRNEQGEIIGGFAIVRDVTERKQVKEALGESEERYRSLVEAAPDVIYTISAEDGSLTSLNPAFETLTGWSRAEWLGKPMMGIVHPDDLPVAVETLQKASRGETQPPYELRVLSKSGEYLVGEFTSTPHVKDGKVVGELGIARDITERKRAEEALRKANELVSAVVHASPVAILNVDGDGRVHMWNPAAEQMFGWSETEVLGQFLPIVPVEQREDFWRVHHPVMTGTEFSGIEVRVQRKDGTSLDAMISIGPVRDSQKNVTAGMAVITDITERKRAEEQLRYQAALLASVNDAIVASDTQYRLTAWNKAAESVYGWKAEEVLGRNGLEILRTEWFGVDADWMRRTIAETGHWRGEVTQTRKDGTRIPVELSSIVLRDESGQITGYVSVNRDITERKRAEEALRESNEYLGNLFNYANAPIIVWDPQFRITRFNHAFESLTGRRAQDVIGKSLDILFPPDLVESSMNLIGKTLGGERWETVEISILHLDGSVRTVLWNSATIFAPDGKTPLATIAQGHDITDRKRAEEARRESEERYRLLAENVTDVIWIMDLDLRYKYISPSVERLRGIAVEEAMMEKSEDTLTPSSFKVAKTALAEELSNASSPQKDPFRSRTLELEQICKDGSTVWTEVRTIFLRDSEGRPVEILGVTRDISARKRAEEALRASEERFRRIVETAEEGIWMIDAESRTTFANRKMADMLGYTREEMTGKSLFSFMDEEGRALAERLIERRRRGVSEQHDFKFRSQDGSSLWALLATSPVFDEAGRYAGALAMVTDITERKQLEEQFRQVQKMEAVGRLAGGVAHDFNNILMAINGYTQLVLRKLSPRHPLRQQLNEIRKAGERAASLTRQLLAFSRRQVLVPRVLDLNKVVADTREMLRRVIGEDVELVIRQGHKLAKVLADPDQIAEVLVNLAVNAREAMPGGGRLTIETGNVDLREAETGDLPGAAPGTYVMLAVSDTGVGMSKEVMEHMFEPFFTTREQGKGTGLGLSMVYGIVKQSGGYVRVQSEPGHGSAFSIYLPCAQVGSGKPAPRSTKARLAKGRGTVLVVEDELAVRQVVAAALRSSGYKVLEAGSGEEAMRRLRRHEGPLHLVLTDLVMPRLNGRQVADCIRPLYPEVKVVFMSGYTDDVLLRQGGSDAQGLFLPKPFTMEVLTQMVREVLKPSP